jgi:hypothetical protein
MKTSHDTLARRMGTTTHISLLLKRAEMLGLQRPEDLQTLAVQRGCRHYWHEGVPSGELVGVDRFSNEDLAVALLDIALPYDPHTIRCGAAMLGADGNDVSKIVRLAIMERSEPVVRYVAEAGLRYEPQNPFWRELLALLPVTRPVKEGVLPHPTRFIAMTGYERYTGPRIQTEWQRPHRPLAA